MNTLLLLQASTPALYETVVLAVLTTLSAVYTCITYTYVSVSWHPGVEYNQAVQAEAVALAEALITEAPGDWAMWECASEYRATLEYVNKHTSWIRSA